MAVKKTPFKPVNTGGRPRHYNTVEDMQKVIDDYFKGCDKKQVPYTKQGLQTALNMSASSITDYRKRDGYSQAIELAEGKIVQQMMERSLTGEFKSQAMIYILDNFFGMYQKRKKVDKDNDTVSMADAIVEAHMRRQRMLDTLSGYDDEIETKHKVPERTAESMEDPNSDWNKYCRDMKAKYGKENPTYEEMYAIDHPEEHEAMEQAYRRANGETEEEEDNLWE